MSQLGVELVFADTEERAAEQVSRICSSAGMLGLDVETAGKRSKVQAAMDTSAALDPFRAEVRLLQVAAEVDRRTVALVIDLRRVPLESPALAPLWHQKLVGHNLSFDAKMLMANGVEIADENLVDTILMAGLVLRGVADKRREGSRRPSLADALREALGVELPKTSQLSPWWRDRLADEQIAYAAVDAVMALRLATALLTRIEKLQTGPHALFRLCKAVMPVARMELAGIALDREALAQQAAAWDQELVGLKGQIAKLGIENPSSSPQVSAWLRPQLKRLEEQSSFGWLSSWPRTPTGGLSTKAKHLRRAVSVLPEAELLVRFSLLAQLRSNFGDKLLNRISVHTGRLHGSFFLAKAKSGDSLVRIRTCRISQNRRRYVRCSSLRRVRCLSSPITHSWNFVLWPRWQRTGS